MNIKYLTEQGQMGRANTRYFCQLGVFLLIVTSDHIFAEFYISAMKDITNFFQADIAINQNTITAYMLGAASASMIFGPLSDIIGTKKPILINLTLLILSSIICAMANNIYVVLFGRLLQGITQGGLSNSKTMLRFAFTDDNPKKALAS